MDEAIKFIRRMQLLNISIELVNNAPWIYIKKINGKYVKETCMGEHGFTLGFMPVRVDGEFKFTDMKEIFKVIRKYK